MDRLEELLIDHPILEECFITAMPEEDQNPENQVRLTPVTPSKSTMERLKESRLRGPDGNPLLQVDLAFVYEKIQRPPMVALHMRLPNKFWLDHIVIKNADTIYGGTGLNAPVIAAATGDLDMTRKYIKCGSDVNFQVKGGNTGLMEAASRGDAETMHVLLEAGADINLQNKEGQTALMVALLEDKADTVLDLVTCGAAADVLTKRGHSALMLAASRGKEGTVGLLVEEANADICLVDQMGLTALCWAELGHPKIAAFLCFALGLRDKFKQFIKESMQRCVVGGRSRLLYTVFRRLLRLLLTFKPARHYLLADDCLRLVTSCYMARSLLQDPKLDISHKMAVQLEPWLLALVNGMMYQEDQPYVQFTKDEAACWLLANVQVITASPPGCDFLDCLLVALLAVERGRDWLHDTALQVREMCRYLATVADRAKNLPAVFKSMMQRYYDRYHLKDQKQALSDAARHTLVPEPPRKVGSILGEVTQRYAELVEQANNKCKELEAKGKESSTQPKRTMKERRRRGKERRQRLKEGSQQPMQKTPVDDVKQQYIISPRENSRDIVVQGHGSGEKCDTPEKTDLLERGKAKNADTDSSTKGQDEVKRLSEPEARKTQDDLHKKTNEITNSKAAVSEDNPHENNAPVLKAGKSHGDLKEESSEGEQFQCGNHSWPSLLESNKKASPSKRIVRRSGRGKTHVPAIKRVSTDSAADVPPPKPKAVVTQSTSPLNITVEPETKIETKESNVRSQNCNESPQKVQDLVNTTSQATRKTSQNVTDVNANDNKEGNVDIDEKEEECKTAHKEKNLTDVLDFAKQCPEVLPITVAPQVQSTVQLLQSQNIEHETEPKEKQQSNKDTECDPHSLQQEPVVSAATTPAEAYHKVISDIISKGLSMACPQSAHTFPPLPQSATEVFMTLPGLLLLAQMQQLTMRKGQSEGMQPTGVPSANTDSSSSKQDVSDASLSTQTHPCSTSALTKLLSSTTLESGHAHLPIPDQTNSQALSENPLANFRFVKPPTDITENNQIPQSTIATSSTANIDKQLFSDQHCQSEGKEHAEPQMSLLSQKTDALISETDSLLSASSPLMPEAPNTASTDQKVDQFNFSKDQKVANFNVPTYIAKPHFPKKVRNFLTPMNDLKSNLNDLLPPDTIPVAAVAPVSLPSEPVAPTTAEPALTKAYMPSIHEPSATVAECEEPELAWRQNSLRWRRHLQELVDLPAAKRRKLGNFYVCEKDEKFVIKRGPLGTQVLIGLHVDGTELAVKKMLRAYYVRVQRTVSALHQGKTELPDQHILPVKEMWSDMYFGYVATELQEENLAERVGNLDNLGLLEEETPTLVRGLLSALQTLQHSQVPHLFLKPSNILLDTEDHLRLSDVMTGTHISTWADSRQDGEALCWRSKEAIAVGEKVLADSPYTSAWDSQVAGMLIHYIATGGRHPYGPDFGKCEQYIAKDRPDCFALTDPAIVSLVRRLLDQNGTTRVPPSQAIRHPYFWEPEEKLLFLASVGQLPAVRDGHANPLCSRLNLTVSALHVQGMAQSLYNVLQQRDYNGSFWFGASVTHILRILGQLGIQDQNSLLEVVPWVTETCQSLVAAAFEVVREEGYIASTEHIYLALKKTVCQ